MPVPERCLQDPEVARTSRPICYTSLWLGLSTGTVSCEVYGPGAWIFINVALMAATENKPSQRDKSPWKN